MSVYVPSGGGFAFETGDIRGGRRAVGASRVEVGTGRFGEGGA